MYSMFRAACAPSRWPYGPKAHFYFPRTLEALLLFAPTHPLTGLLQVPLGTATTRIYRILDPVLICWLPLFWWFLASVGVLEKLVKDVFGEGCVQFRQRPGPSPLVLSSGGVLVRRLLHGPVRTQSEQAPHCLPTVKPLFATSSPLVELS